MLKLTSPRLQQLWGLLVGTIVVASLLPCLGIHNNILDTYLDGHWAHFLAYVAISFLPMLIWRRNTALAISMGIAVLGTGLEIVRATVGARSPDFQHIVINALGIAAGILLGLNILTRRSRISQADI
jgi:predicted signal transduction protein with EAL and GGDEF domain